MSSCKDTIDRTEAIERLATPRRRQEVGMNYTGSSGIPPNPLPTWENLPLDAKLPMLPAPESSVSLYTTNMGENLRWRCPDLDFDLNDPNAILMSTMYQPLHDPHLKLHLNSPMIRRRLEKGGFITRDGKVLCTLKEYNEYRQYLRDLNLALEKKKEKEMEEMQRASSCEKKEDSAASAVAKQREHRSTQVRNRLAMKHEADHKRYTELMKEEERRKQRLKEQHSLMLSAKEREQREKDEKRRIVIQRRQQEDRAKRLQKVNKWSKEDGQRAENAQKLRMRKVAEKQNTLQDMWEARKAYQEKKMRREQLRARREEELFKRRIEERQLQADLLAQKRNEKFLRMIEKRREEYERLSARYAELLNEKIKKKHRAKSARQRRPRRKAFSTRGLKSNFDIEQQLLSTLSEQPVTQSDLEDVKGKKERLITLVTEQDEDNIEEKSSKYEQSASAIGLGDFHGANFNNEVIKVAESMSSLSRSNLDAIGVTSKEKDVSNVALSEFKGACLAPDSMDALKQKSSIGSQPSRSGYSIGGSSQMSALDLYDVLKANKRMKSRRPTPALTDLQHKPQRMKMTMPSFSFEEEGEEEDETVMEVRDHSVVEEEEKEGEEEGDDDEKLDDIEKAAKAIVDMSLYLTTQVIYPAYLRYLEEDHPEVYIQMIGRPQTPLPSTHLADLAADDQRLGNGSVEIHIDQCEEEQNFEDFDYSKIYSNYVNADEVGTVERQRSVRFNDEREDIPPSDLEDLETRQEYEMARRAVDSGAESDDEAEISSSNLSLGYRDSLTLAHEIAEVADLRKTLKHVMTLLQDGALSHDQIVSLTSYAKHLMFGSQTIPTDAEDDKILNEVAEAAPNISDLAKRVVTDTVEKVQKTLVQDKEFMLQQDLEKIRYDPSNTGAVSQLADIIVSKSVSHASSRLELISQDMTRDEPSGRPVSAPVGTLTTPKTEEMKTSSFDLDRSASTFIDNVLKQVASEVKSEVKKTIKEPSETSLYVKKIIDEAVQELKESVSLQAIDEKDSPTKPRPARSSSSISVFIRQTLGSVLGELEKEGMLPTAKRSIVPKSASSTFAETLVYDTLQKCLAEIKQDTMDPKAILDLTVAFVKSQRSIRDQIGSDKDKATKSLEKVDVGGDTVAQLVLESLAKESLSRTLKDIKDGKIPPEELKAMAENIRGSPLTPPQKQGFLASLSFTKRGKAAKTASSSMAEDYVKKAIEEVLEGFLDEAALDMDWRKVFEAAVKVEPRTAESRDIDRLVQSALSAVCKELGATGGYLGVTKSDTLPSSDSNRPPLSAAKSETGQLTVTTTTLKDNISGVSDLIEDALKTAMSDIVGNIPPPTPKTGQPAPTSKSTDEINDFIQDIIHNAAQEISKLFTATPPGTALNATAEKQSSSEVVGKCSIHSNSSKPHINFIDDGTLVDIRSNSSSENVCITPVMGDEEVHIDHAKVEQALNVLSVKHDHHLEHIHNNDPVERYSYRNLIRPDISKTRRFSVDSSEQVLVKHLEQLAERHISLGSSHDDGKVTPPEDHFSEDSQEYVEDEDLISGIEEEMEVGFVEIHHDISKESINSMTDEQKLSGNIEPASKDEPNSVADTKSAPKQSATYVSKTSKTSKEKIPSQKLSRKSVTSVRSKEKTPSKTSTSSFASKKTSPKKDILVSPRCSTNKAAELRKSFSDNKNSPKGRTQSKTSKPFVAGSVSSRTSMTKEVKSTSSMPLTRGNSPSTFEKKLSATDTCNVNNSKSPEKLSKSNITSAIQAVKTVTSESAVPSKTKQIDDEQTLSVVKKSSSSKLDNQKRSTTPVKLTPKCSKQSLKSRGQTPEAEEVPEEIEIDRRQFKTISARKKSSSSMQHGSNSSIRTFTSNLSTKKSSSRQIPSQQQTSSKHSSKSSLAGKSSRHSHQTVNLTPRPSSGYRKSPTPGTYDSKTKLSPENSPCKVDNILGVESVGKVGLSPKPSKHSLNPSVSKKEAASKNSLTPANVRSKNSNVAASPKPSTHSLEPTTTEQRISNKELSTKQSNKDLNPSVSKVQKVQSNPTHKFSDTGISTGGYLGRFHSDADIEHPNTEYKDIHSSDHHQHRHHHHYHPEKSGVQHHLHAPSSSTGSLPRLNASLEDTSVPGETHLVDEAVALHPTDDNQHITQADPGRDPSTTSHH